VGKIRVIIELSHNKKLESNMSAMMSEAAPRLDKKAVPELKLLQYDESFGPVALPGTTRIEFDPNNLYDTSEAFSIDTSMEASTYIVRGEVEKGDIDELTNEAAKSGQLVGVFADPQIQSMQVCPGAGPVGDHLLVEKLLCVDSMRAKGMDGSGVMVAVVDTGVNMTFLNSKGKTPSFDAARSWSWDPSVVTPGNAPVGHGTMCAYDVCIAAPKATILDIALLHGLLAPPGGVLMDSFLSDAIRAYGHLSSILQAGLKYGKPQTMVISNSWGMFHPSWDWPVGAPGNYSDNPNHPFNKLVATVEKLGADIVFAAGNCGKDCPDGRCQNVTDRSIYGANSSSSVLCVAGVDTTKTRVGYSAIGPGRLTIMKPDICGYTHFKGSGVYAADGGTSAACPVVSGVVAAVRSARPYNPSQANTAPSAIRNLLTSTATDLGSAGYDYLHGYGVVNGCGIVKKLFPKTRLDLCERFPKLCFPIKPPFPRPPLPKFPVGRPPLPRPANPLSTAGMEGAGFPYAEDEVAPGEEDASWEALRYVIEDSSPEAIFQLGYLKGLMGKMESGGWEEK